MSERTVSLARGLAIALVSLPLVTAPSRAQTPSASAPTPAPTPASDDALRVTVPTVTVTAQKEPEDRQKVPVSVTAVTRETDRGRRHAAWSATRRSTRRTPSSPSSTARKLSNARFRGIGSSPSNPGITTYIDGVPQLNANSSSIELLDVDQIEFVRGPQSALFGRNTLGGLVNITSSRPSLTKWTGALACRSATTARGRARQRVGPGRAGPASRSAFSLAQVQPRRVHRQRRHRPRHRQPRSAFSARRSCC